MTLDDFKSWSNWLNQTPASRTLTSGETASVRKSVCITTTPSFNRRRLWSWSNPSEPRCLSVICTRHGLCAGWIRRNAPMSSNTFWNECQESWTPASPIRPSAWSSNMTAKPSNPVRSNRKSETSGTNWKNQNTATFARFILTATGWLPDWKCRWSLCPAF